MVNKSLGHWGQLRSFNYLTDHINKFHKFIVCEIPQ